MRRILGWLTCGWCCCAKINGKRVPAWQLDQVPLGTDQFTSVDSEVDEMHRRRGGAGGRDIVHVSLSEQDALDDFVMLTVPEPEMPRFRIVVQLQIVNRDNYLRNDLMNPTTCSVIEMVMGSMTIEGPFVRDEANGTISFLAQCSYQNVAAMWCDPLQWPAVTAALSSRMLRLAFARRIGPKVATVEEALKGEAQES